MIYDYKYRPQPSFPDIEEIFAPFIAAASGKTPTPKTDIGQVAPDGSVYTLAVEIPRLVRDTIAVSVEPITTDYKTMANKVVVKATENLLSSYLNSLTKSAKKLYEQEFLVLGQRVALDGELGLSYSEGVLVIEIPLCKPVQAKKASLSARLADIEN